MAQSLWCDVPAGVLDPPWLFFAGALTETGSRFSVWETRLGLHWRAVEHTRRLLPWKSEVDLAVGAYYTDLNRGWQDPICRLLKLLPARSRHENPLAHAYDRNRGTTA